MTKEARKYYINMIIGFLIIIGFWVSPPFLTLTPVGMHVIGTLVGVVWLWCTCDMIWPSFLLVILIGLSGATEGVTASIAAALTNTIAIMLMFVGIAVCMISKSGVMDYLLNKLFSIKFIQGKPWIMIFTLFFGGYLIAILIGPIILIPLFFSVLDEVMKAINVKKGDKLYSTMIVGVVYSLSFGATFMPIQPIPALVHNIMQGYTGATFGFGEFIGANFIIDVCLIICYVLMMKYIFRVDVTSLKQFSGNSLENGKEKIKMTLDQKLSLLFIMILILSLLLPSILPKNMAITSFYTNVLTQNGFLILFTVLLLAIRRNNGKPFVTWLEHVKSLPWNIIAIMYSVGALTPAMQAEGTGIRELMTMMFAPVFSIGNTAVIMILVCIIAIICTNLFNNVVSALLLATSVCALAATIPINVPGCLMLLVLSIKMGIMLPASSAYGAFLHGNTNMPTKDGYKYAFCTLVMHVIILAVVGIPVVNMIFM